MDAAVEVREYSLPDALLLSAGRQPFRCLVWQPQATSIVIGHGSNIDRALHLDNVALDNIPVYKRPSGGESVLLSPRTLVVSLLKAKNGIKNAKKYFQYFNETIIHALESLGIRGLSLRGISDIALGEQKILGSAIYQDKDRLFYHGVLNAAESPLLIEKYLKHPQREPDWRRGRSHRDFVTSLHEQGYRLDIEEIRKSLEKELLKNNDSRV